MKVLTMLLVAGLLALAGCGGDDDTSATGSKTGTSAATEANDANSAATETKDANSAAAENDDEGAATKHAAGIELTVAASDFGEMLFDSGKQAIYIFEKDPKGESVCYGDCAQAWPPVFTKGEPVGRKGVKASLLGTIKRRDGKRQVTYAGKPLYYYAHERPGEVRCHNVNLNGGFWWVVGPDGKRRP